MTMKSGLRKVAWLFSRGRKRTELDEELRFHLETDREEREQTGDSTEAARRNARIDFGNVTLAREDTQATWGWKAIEQLNQDVRYAARTMRRSPAFTALAALSLALGIGANTAIFSFMDAMLFRDLPVSNPTGLVRMTWRTARQENHGLSRHASGFRDPATGYTNGVFSYPAFEFFQRHSHLFSAVFAYQGTGALSLSAHGQAEAGNGEFVSGDYFRALGVPAAAGRWIDPNDDRTDASPVVVLGSSFSRAHFAAPADAIGQTLLVNTKPFTIVGVAPSEFFGTDPGRAPDVFLPLQLTILVDPMPSDAAKRFTDDSEFWLEVMARRRDDVSVERAQAELAPVFQRMSTELATKGRWRQAPSLELKAGGDGIDGLRRTYRAPLVMLIGLGALILALACANIANLLLARASARAREMAVRLSLGAGRGRVFRQLVTESVTLSCAGGLLGIGVAMLTQRWMTGLLGNGGAAFGVRADLSWPILMAAVGLSVITGLLFGVIPALHATRGSTMMTLKSVRTTSSYSWRGPRIRRVLLVSQVAITLVMLMSAGLFLRTLRNYSAIDLGFRSDHLLTFAVRARQANLSDEQAITLFRALRDRLATLPGVESVGLSDLLMMGNGTSSETVAPIGREVRESSAVLSVGGGFFSTLEIPILRGRGIEQRDDRPGAAPVAVVDETYARRYLDGVDPIGQRLRVPGGSRRVAELQIEVVGVAANARYGRLTGDREPTVYFPFSIGLFGSVDRMVFELRTSVDPASLSNAVRAVVHDANPNVPIARLVTQSTLIDAMLNREILLARLCTMFAFLALFIAIVGLYGTVLHDVSRRRTEIGVRMALGARHGQVIRMVLREVLLVVSIGFVIGVPAAWSATQMVEAFFFGVTRRDLQTFAVAIGLLLGTALLAGYVPARAASRVNPTVALRVD